MRKTLPIDALLPDIVGALRSANRLVLRAAPGAGKTTRVPAALLDAGLAGDRQILVLEPRRIAARAAAEYVAGARGGQVGGEVGYRVRFEQRGGAATRLWFLTEGVLGRQLARDPFLEDVGIVILDEFHERHLQGDVALAVVRELQRTVRPELKLVVMSATLETAALARYLDDCPVLTSEGRAHPVRIEHAEAVDDRPLAGRVAGALRRLLADRDERGDVLVFLPGAAEIRRAAEAIAPLAAAHELLVLPLHGDLPLDQQQRVLRRAERRKVVLATNVAETSLTIDGVTAVIDSGLARIARHDPRHGVNALRLAPISRAAAEQRAGRAGRTEPGRCLRLWTAAEHAARLEREVPEIRRLELSATLLELRAWGLRDMGSFGWLDAPPAASVARAERLLSLLGAVDATGALTGVGGRLLAMPVAPRLGRLLLEAERRGCAERGALLAALASERDMLRAARFGEPAADRPAGRSDLLLRAELFDEAARARFDAAACSRLGIDAGAVRAVDRARRQLADRIPSPASGEGQEGGPLPSLPPKRGKESVTGKESETGALRAVLAGFPDRVVRRRAAGSARGVMVGGTGVVLDPASVVREHELFVAVEIEGGRGADLRVRVASAVERAWLDEMFPHAIVTTDALHFDPGQQRVVRRVREHFRDLVLAERVRADVDRAAAGTVLAAAIRRDPGLVEPGDVERAFLARLRFLQRAMPELGLPDDPQSFRADALVALCDGKRRIEELRRADVLGVLRGLLARAQLAALEREAPERYTLPTGREVAIAYDPERPPSFAARIQEVFGLRTTPRLAGGRVPLVIELLAPSQRPVQITDDLESFWRTGYAEVRKELRGRYPKHPWPDDPLTAPPTSRAKRRGE